MFKIEASETIKSIVKRLKLNNGDTHEFKLDTDGNVTLTSLSNVNGRENKIVQTFDQESWKMFLDAGKEVQVRAPRKRRTREEIEAAQAQAQ